MPLIYLSVVVLTLVSAAYVLVVWLTLRSERRWREFRDSRRPDGGDADVIAEDPVANGLVATRGDEVLFYPGVPDGRKKIARPLSAAERDEDDEQDDA